MVGRPLDHDFALRSPLSLRAPHQVGREELLTELLDEAVRRQHAYPRLVDSGTLKAADAEHHMAVWRAMIDDHHRADAECQRYLGRKPRHEAGPWAYDWPTRIREIRRELALRRAAYPKWVASPTNPLTAADAARKLERLDALHYRYWADLFCFSPPGIQRDRDPRRAAWAATAERRRQEPRWQRDVLEGGDDDSFAAHVARRARYQADCWRVIEFTAHIAAGEPVGFGLPDHRDIAIVAAEARRRADEAYEQHLAGDLTAAELGQLEMVARWLRCGDIAPTLSGTVYEERMAA